MKEVVELARRLGVTIAAHEHWTALKAARDAMKEDTEAQRLEKEYAEIADRLEEKAREGKPLEPDEKRLEAELRSQLAQQTTVREFVRAQADFNAMMHAVHEAIESELDG